MPLSLPVLAGPDRLAVFAPSTSNGVTDAACTVPNAAKLAEDAMLPSEAR